MKTPLKKLNTRLSSRKKFLRDVKVYKRNLKRFLSADDLDNKIAIATGIPVKFLPKSKKLLTLIGGSAGQTLGL